METNSNVCVFQVDDFQGQMSELEQQLLQKTHETEVMQTELKQNQEFSKKRSQMQKELEEVSTVHVEAACSF